MTAQFRISFTAAALAGLATLGAARPAEAAFRLVLTNGAATSTQFETSPGTIFLSDFVIGSFKITGTLSTSNATGTASLGYIDQSDLRVTNVTGPDNQLSTLELKLIDDTFLLPAGSPLSLEGSLGGPSQLDPGNTGGDTAIITQTSSLISGATTNTPTLSTSLVGVGDQAQVLAARGNPSFTLQQVVNVSLGLGGVASFTALTEARVTAVPEPTNIALAGIGVLLSLGALRRRGRA